jgi:polyhydroxybutyrate depolymerase
MTRWVTFGLSLTLVFAVGCGDDDDDAGSGGSPSTGGASGSGGSAGSSSGGTAGASGSSSTGGQANGCNGGSLQPGNSNRKITVGGIEREYNLHVPPSYDPATPIPLVLNFHGFTSNMAQQELFSMMSPKADSAGFIVAYPNGLKNASGAQSWNAGFCCADDPTRDDVGFVNAMLDDLEGAGCIDAKRVYATGMSNGGYMSHLLGCKLADRIAAIAPVAGVLGIPAAECQPSRPLSVIHFHGTADTLVEYDAGYVTVPDSFAGWGERNGCTGTPKPTFTNGTAHCETYDTCDAGVSVTLCTLEGEGHCWPGQTLCPFGASTTDLIADDAMWDLFEKTSLP